MGRGASGLAGHKNSFIGDERWQGFRELATLKNGSEFTVGYLNGKQSRYQVTLSKGKRALKNLGNNRVKQYSGQAGLAKNLGNPSSIRITKRG